MPCGVTVGSVLRIGVAKPRGKKTYRARSIGPNKLWVVRETGHSVSIRRGSRQAAHNTLAEEGASGSLSLGCGGSTPQRSSGPVRVGDSIFVNHLGCETADYEPGEKPREWLIGSGAVRLRLPTLGNRGIGSVGKGKKAIGGGYNWTPYTTGHFQAGTRLGKRMPGSNKGKKKRCVNYGCTRRTTPLNGIAGVRTEKFIHRYCSYECLEIHKRIVSAGAAKRVEEFRVSGFVTSSDRWRKLRYDALKKSNRRCELCGEGKGTGAVLHVDHIKPVSLFPELKFDPNNLQVLCEACNLGKGNRDATDWRVSE